jgi:DNA polymerase-3 subunit delta
LVKQLPRTPESEGKTILIYIIFGKEDGLVALELENLINKLLTTEEKLTALLSFDGSKATISDVLDELRTLPFLAQKRVVVIKNADKFISDNRQVLEDYFDSPSPTGVLVLTVESWRADTKLAKKLANVGSLLTVKSPTQAELPMRVIRYAQDAYRKKIDRHAADLIVELTGNNLAGLYSQVDKLALFAEGKNEITISDVEQLIGRNRLFNAFEVIDSCLAGNVDKAVSRLRDMLDKDKDAEYTVIGAFAFHFRRLFNARVLFDKGTSAQQVARQLGLWHNVDGFLAQAKRLSLEKVGGFLEELAELDYAVKTGRSKVDEAMENLVLRLTV